MPTRLRNASAEDSPQYPAAIAAGIRRGQEPIGMMAERRIAETKKLTSHETDRARAGYHDSRGLMEESIGACSARPICRSQSNIARRNRSTASKAKLLHLPPKSGRLRCLGMTSRF